MTKLNPILSKPKHGWSSFNIENFSFPVSYVKDTPRDLIDAFTVALSEGWNHSVVEIDGESEGNCLVIVCPYAGIYTIRHRSDNDIDIKYFCINIKRIAGQFIKDIENYKEEWADWQSFGQEEDKKYYDLSELKKLVE